MKVTTLHTRTWRRIAWARKAAVACARLLFAFVILAGIVHSGGRYFYCEALGLSCTDPCVQASSGSEKTCPAKTLGPRSLDCCEVITLPSTPDGARVASPRVSPAGVLSVLPACSFVDSLLGDDLSVRRIAFGRWRAPPRYPREHRARLMVFLT